MIFRPDASLKKFFKFPNKFREKQQIFGIFFIFNIEIFSLSEYNGCVNH